MMMKRYLLLILLIEAPQDVTSRSKASGCRQDEYFDGEACVSCQKCPSGQGLSNDCGYGDGLGVKCIPCKPGQTFREGNDPYLKCKSCTNCKLYQRDLLHSCRPSIDAECGLCFQGYFETSVFPKVLSVCESCSRYPNTAQCQNQTNRRLNTPSVSDWPISKPNITLQHSMDQIHKKSSIWPVIAIIVPVILLLLIIGGFIYWRTQCDNGNEILRCARFQKLLKQLHPRTERDNIVVYRNNNGSGEALLLENNITVQTQGIKRPIKMHYDRSISDPGPSTSNSFTSSNILEVPTAVVQMQGPSQSSTMAVPFFDSSSSEGLTEVQNEMDGYAASLELSEASTLLVRGQDDQDMELIRGDNNNMTPLELSVSYPQNDSIHLPAFQLDHTQIPSSESGSMERGTDIGTLSTVTNIDVYSTNSQRETPCCEITLPVQEECTSNLF